METWTDTTFQLGEEDTLIVTPHKDCVSLHLAGFLGTNEQKRGFALNFRPSHLTTVYELYLALRKCALPMLLLMLLAGQAQASPPEDWCPALLFHAKVILVDQTDDDLYGSYSIPESVPKEDHKAYKKMIRRTRSLLQLYHKEVTTDTMLDLLKADCANVYNPAWPSSR